MTNSALVRYITLAIAVLFGTAILVTSILPIDRVALGTRAIPGNSSELVDRAAILHILLHFAIFVTLACLSWTALHLWGAGAVNKMIGLLTIMLLGWETEYCQHRLFDNPLEVSDVLLNMFATAATFGLLALWSRGRKLPSEPEPDGEPVANILRGLD